MAAPSKLVRFVRQRWPVLLLLLVFAAGAGWVAWRGGISPKEISAWIDGLGLWGPVLYVGVFVVAALIALPGMAFVVAARLAFGPTWGFPIAFFGGLCAVTVPFVLARALRRGERDAFKPTHRWLVRALDAVERYPFRAVVVIRVIVWFNSPVTYALAFTRIRTTTYVAACAVALAPVVAVAVLATGWFT